MNKKLLLTIATALGITAAATSVVAAPLPFGTLLKITKTTTPDGGVIPCTNGSCFGFYLIEGLYAWIPLGPGTDGGIVIGKPQKSGGQQIDPFSTADGELSAVWSLGSNNGTFFTDPDSTGNIFDDASCAGSACIGKTELRVFNAAWYGYIIPLGSASGCDPKYFSHCTPDQSAGIFVKSWTINPVEGGDWTLEYSQVGKEVSGFINYPFEFILRGTVSFLPPIYIPPAVVVTPADITGVYGAAIPFTITVTDFLGQATPACRIGTAPASGVVALTNCTGGTYTANPGFIGTDSFTIIANNSLLDSAPATVTAAITAPTTNTACTIQYPARQVTYNSKSTLTMVVTGNISRTTTKEVRICPTTQLEYNATSTFYPVTCYINNAFAAPKGSVAVGSQLKCNLKPYANDQYSVNIKSAI